MSADEDTELRDLVAQTLESNGVLGKIRAQLRASVFLALEEQENVQNKKPFENAELKKFLSTKDGQTVVGLVREFLDFFSLEFTQAVLEPESGCGSNIESRAGLSKELQMPDQTGGPKVPLLLEVVRNARQTGGDVTKVDQPTTTQSSSTSSVPQELTSQQLADARKKFEYYDRDKNNEIEKEELRDLFIDLFPNFNKNMLDRYVNDEFRAADRDISNSISFNEFVGMYKRLFLQCRSVVAGDAATLLSPTTPKSVSSPRSKASNSERSHTESRSQRTLENGGKQVLQDNNNTDTEEDFFDDPIPPSSPGYRFGSKGLDSSDDSKRSGTSSSSARPSQIPRYSGKQRSDNKSGSKSSGAESQKGGVPQGGHGQTSAGMSSLSGLPSLTGDRPAGRKSRQLPVFRHPSNASSVSAQGDTSENLRAMDKRMSELGLDGDAQDYSYEDDFQSEGPSLSQKSPRTRSEAKSQNGSIAEEIEEDIDELSIEADDLLHSEKSAFDDMTTDRTISQHESGFDYIEDLMSP